MTRDIRKILTATAVSLALAVPVAAFCQAGTAPNDSQQGRNDAREMVRGTVALTHALDAKKDHDGAQFAAKLTGTVHLNDGKTLAKGTMLIGAVESDDMQMTGKSKLAVRFIEAKLNDGESIPIDAKIVQVYPPYGFTAGGSVMPNGSDSAPGEAFATNDWNQHILKVDQVDALNDVDMHSRLASQNSGVFVSAKKDDVKIMQGTQMDLALALQGNGQQADTQ